MGAFAVDVGCVTDEPAAVNEAKMDDPARRAGVNIDARARPLPTGVAQARVKGPNDLAETLSVTSCTKTANGRLHPLRATAHPTTVGEHLLNRACKRRAKLGRIPPCKRKHWSLIGRN
jgi:hypothetical protein